MKKRCKGTISVSMVVIGVLLHIWVSASSVPASDTSDLISYIRGVDTLEFCGEKIPLEIEEIRERFEKEFLLILWNRPQVILWLKRSQRYFPFFERMQKENSMPDDLKYVAIIESALRPHMRSRKGAIGFWQFMASTGLEYGLKINRHIDERRNFFASSRAAIRYFKKLHESFGSWVLAVSAFNMGEKRLKAEIIEQGTADFFQLYLPLETQRFLFRIISVKLIFSDPFRYGFKLDKADYYHQLSFDRIKMKSVDQIPIQIIAQAAETQFKVIKDLNPEIRGHYLVSGNHDILIPKGASEGFHKRFQALFENYLTVSKKRVYIVKKGDNLSLIANRFNIPLATLLIWNRLDFRRPIHPGDRLIIYPVKKKPKK
ncbi:MAG: transglycosylase SLT domain-containing protein [Desulfobacterales bacterium]|jgi:hypothetical protein|nr:transglycosylase SLT domain-containing protein [Desulfobacterales bacterium]